MNNRISLVDVRYIGDHEKHIKTGRLLGAHSHTITNPIITVTEHTPTPSPDFLKRQVSRRVLIKQFTRKNGLLWRNFFFKISIDSQLDEISLQGKQLFSQERKPSLTRSQTDSNITYACEELPEAPGSSSYVTKDGDIDIQVVLKVIRKFQK